MKVSANVLGSAAVSFAVGMYAGYGVNNNVAFVLGSNAVTFATGLCYGLGTDQVCAIAKWAAHRVRCCLGGERADAHVPTATMQPPPSKKAE